MGKLLKFIMVVIAAAVLIFIVYGAITGISNLENPTDTSQHTTSVMPGKKEYDKVLVGDSKTGKGGMTLKEVEKILGEGTLQTESKQGNSVVDVYTFAASAGPNSILVTFVNGHAAGKTQTGLK